jgi:hypothetical protein
MMRIRRERHEARGAQLVGGPLHGLTRQSHGSGEMSDRPARFSERNRAENLPTRAGQTEVGRQTITQDQELAVQAKDFQDQFREGARRARPLLRHRHIDNILSC